LAALERLRGNHPPQGVLQKKREAGRQRGRRSGGRGKIEKRGQTSKLDLFSGVKKGRGRAGKYCAPDSCWSKGERKKGVGGDGCS